MVWPQGPMNKQWMLSSDAELLAWLGSCFHWPSTMYLYSCRPNGTFTTAVKSGPLCVLRVRGKRGEAAHVWGEWIRCVCVLYSLLNVATHLLSSCMAIGLIYTVTLYKYNVRGYYYGCFCVPLQIQCKRVLYACFCVFMYAMVCMKKVQNNACFHVLLFPHFIIMGTSLERAWATPT